MIHARPVPIFPFISADRLVRALLTPSRSLTDCYSDRGWLAIDVFTCGGHDPRPLAASIRQHVEERAPGVRCLMHENVPRFHYDADYTETEAAPSKDVTAAATAAVAAASASTTSAAAASAGVASASAAANPAAATDVAAMNVAAATASPSRPQTPGPASTIRLLRQRRRSTAGVMRASAPLVRMLAPSGEGEAPLEDSATPSPEDAAEGSSAGDAAGSALMASFASRLEEEGGAAKLQMQSERERASRAVKQSSSAAVKGLTSLVDLDSEKAKAARPEGGDGLLDVQSWRLTVAFFVLTIGLAFFSAATTDFGDGSTELGGSGAVEVTRGIDNAGVDYLLGRR